jgi:hypothetical protein
MAGPTELPELIKEFTDMSKEYLRQETLDPAKELGRYAGFAIGAAVCFAIGAVLLSVAGVRLIVDALPTGPNWSALGYLIATVVIAVMSALLVKFAADDRKRG